MIFSLFGKKDKPSPSAEKSPTVKKPDKGPSREADSARASSAQRQAAQATARKIDAIESEMSSEFSKAIRDTAANSTIPGPITTPPRPVPSDAKPVTMPKKNESSALSGDTTTATLGTSTLHGDTVTHGHGHAAIAHSESAPVIEEAAILFANDQVDMAEHALQAAIHDDSLGAAALTAWRMLFDLYQITGRQADFDRLSIDFASKFETSPPSWTGGAATDTQTNAAPASTKTAPIVPFSGKLDGSIVKQLERAQNLAAKSPVLRLEFAKVTEVDPIGCGILMSVLKKLQKSGNDLILVGALELVAKIRSILEVGRRAETEAPRRSQHRLLRHVRGLTAAIRAAEEQGDDRSGREAGRRAGRRKLHDACRRRGQDRSAGLLHCRVCVRASDRRTGLLSSHPH
ncbi:MAG: hypothetical protein K0S28_2141 [Paucimonas sp.]|nr:hypothetical protein [Paucimonas sp.]